MVFYQATSSSLYTTSPRKVFKFPLEMVHFRTVQNKLCLSFWAVTPLIMVRFEKFKNWLTAEIGVSKFSCKSEWSKKGLCAWYSRKMRESWQVCSHCGQGTYMSWVLSGQGTFMNGVHSGYMGATESRISEVGYPRFSVREIYPDFSI